MLTKKGKKSVHLPELARGRVFLLRLQKKEKKTESPRHASTRLPSLDDKCLDETPNSARGSVSQRRRNKFLSVIVTFLSLHQQEQRERERVSSSFLVAFFLVGS